jgi:hypothetical protein
MSWWMEVPDDAPAPKRGDLIYSAVGTKKERTWIILRSVPMKRTGNRRYSILRARWWEIEPDMRIKLYRSAERNGGQGVWHTWPLRSAKKKGRVPNFGF